MKNIVTPMNETIDETIKVLFMPVKLTRTPPIIFPITPLMPVGSTPTMSCAFTRFAGLTISFIQNTIAGAKIANPSGCVNCAKKNT